MSSPKSPQSKVTHIRRAGPKDIKLITKMMIKLAEVGDRPFEPLTDTEFPKHFHMQNDLQASLRNKSTDFVAISYEDDKPVGYIWGQLVVRTLFKEQFATLRNIYVDHDKLGKEKRHGARLLEDFESWARENKVKHITLQVYSENGRARKFYSDNGYLLSNLMTLRKDMDDPRTE